VNESDAYTYYCRPDLGEFLKAIRLDIPYHRASGDYLYYLQDDQEVGVLDLLGGYGALILGHNHPEIVQAAKELLEKGTPIHAQASIRSASALLAKRLSDVARSFSGETYVVTFGNSGAEAVEAAIKHATLEISRKIERILRDIEHRFTRLEDGLEKNSCYLPKNALNESIFGRSGMEVRSLEDLRAHVLRHNSLVFQRPPAFLALEGSFHGKTVGALHLTANLTYREPFQRLGLKAKFLRRDDIEDFDRALTEEIRPYYSVDLDERGHIRVLKQEFLNVSACIVEPIQGEGGIRPLARSYLKKLQERCSSNDIPLILDEIQTGMGRTGSILYAHKLGIKGDYYLLSKGLGGGLAKISALLIAQRRYKPEFSLLHTSTYAEDDFSSTVARKALDILEGDDGALLTMCEEKGRYLIEGLRKIQDRYPEVIKEVRGDGLMIGLEFQDQYHSSSNILRQLSHQSDLVYCIAGHLLQEHRIRVAPTLSQSFTLRVEPSLLIPYVEMDRFLSAIEQVAEILHYRDTFHLCKYIVGMETPSERPEVLDYRHNRVEDPSSEKARRVAFIGHFIEARHCADYDEALKRMQEDKLDQFLRRMERRIKPCILSRVNVRSRLGDVVNFNFIGLTLTSRRIVELMQAGDLAFVRKLIDEGIELARKCGCIAVGLGQYTSIVTRNCTDLIEKDMAITSGNSLTVAMGIEGLLKAAQEKGIALGATTLGVVGAGGNICRVYSSIMADKVHQMVLFGNPRPGAAQKCYQTAFSIYRDLIEEMRYRQGEEMEGIGANIYDTKSVQALLRKKEVGNEPGRALFYSLREELGEDRFIRISQDLGELRETPLLVTAANAAEPFIGPEHLRQDAVVLDIAVPMNTRPETEQQRPDVLVIQGGIVKLPYGEDVGVKAIPLKPGTVFACMAETMLLGLADMGTHYSYGDIQKKQVKKIGEIASIHGFTLADYRTQKSF